MALLKRMPNRKSWNGIITPNLPLQGPCLVGHFINFSLLFLTLTLGKLHKVSLFPLLYNRIMQVAEKLGKMK